LAHQHESSYRERGDLFDSSAALGRLGGNGGDLHLDSLIRDICVGLEVLHECGFAMASLLSLDIQIVPQLGTQLAMLSHYRIESHIVLAYG
jgi:hypothetical protein